LDDNAVDFTIIKDVITLGEHRKGGDLPALPIPDLESGELVSPSHLDRLPDNIKENIYNWYIDDVPVREITLKLRQLGYDCHHLRVWRYCKSQFRGDALDVPAMEEEHRLKIERKAVYNALDVAIDIIKRVKVGDIVIKDAKSFEQIAGAIAKLQSSDASRTRVEYEKDGAVKKVQETMKMEVKRLLAGNPELISKVQAYIDQAAEKIIE
jgi:hypothetical protein